MFKSIRWKFITVYFLLVFIAMVIVGVFIVEKLQENLENQITKDMEDYINNLINGVSGLSENDWLTVADDIQNTLNEWGSSGYSERLYIIYNSPDIPRVIASIKGNDTLGESAYDHPLLKEELILKALNGERIFKDYNSTDGINIPIKHVAYPVEDEVGHIKGIIYMTSNLENMVQTLEESKEILTKATLLALLITVLLGFFIASSITGPIKDVTIKAARMAKGDFDQVVEVKSQDEIGKLAGMFNHLTGELNNTIKELKEERSKVEKERNKVEGERNKLETIVTHMADGVIAEDIDGNIIISNKGAKETLGIKEDDSRSLDEVFNTFDRTITLKEIKNKGNWSGDSIIEIEDLALKVKHRPFTNNNDKVGGLIYIIEDITEQQRLENMRKEFVANVSHELKTPITTIKSYTETLLDGALEDKEFSNRFLNVIDNECDRMDRIVRDLLQLSNLDYKKTKWNKTKVSLKDLLDDIYYKMIISAKDKNHDMNFNIDDDIPSITIDKDRIEQVILNIISNAIKYTPEGGNIKVHAFKNQESIIIRVKDTGMGIPKEDLSRVFERFYRVDKARSRAMGGTGLGLSIAKQIIESHGGDIAVRSEYNEGTEVDIILPIN